MAETLYLERVVDPRFEGEDVRIENRGVNKFRLYTGAAGDFDFNNRLKQERFDSNFVAALNGALGGQQQLDVRDREVMHALSSVRRDLEHDAKLIKFRVTFRMQT